MRSTDNRPAANDPAENRPPKTMGEISHRNPYTGEPAGEFFNRGPIVRTDGGRSAAESERTDDGADETSAPEEDDPKDDDRSTDRMRDVDHTPPKEAADANRVFERGGREETVESEE
ncbi:hypothetical protein [Halovivax sp.]|uniref:hypothetical protein n=1 Tax=Halovivax sp. TaxID=1935978 RepID=UPI0025BC7D48|nr:hypothetical protein [Halovivax sp.]